MFGYRSPVGVDLHRQRIQERFYTDRRRKGGSEHQQRRMQKKICIGGESRQDQFLDEKGSRRASTSTDGGREVRNINSGGSRRRCTSAESRGRISSSTRKDPGELLHRQTVEGRFGTSTAEDLGEDLHRRRVTAGSTHRREGIMEWIFIGKGSRRASTSTDGRRRLETSTAEDPGEDLHRRSVTAGSTYRRERIKEWIFIGRGSRRASTSTDGRSRVGTSPAQDPGEDMHRRSVMAGSTHRRERSETRRTRERSETERIERTVEK